MIQKLNVIDINSDNANEDFRYKGTYFAIHNVISRFFQFGIAILVAMIIYILANKNEILIWDTIPS